MRIEQHMAQAGMEKLEGHKLPQPEFQQRGLDREGAPTQRRVERSTCRPTRCNNISRKKIPTLAISKPLHDRRELRHEAAAPTWLVADDNPDLQCPCARG